jgi:thiol:disulfide interchange protein
VKHWLVLLLVASALAACAKDHAQPGEHRAGPGATEPAAASAWVKISPAAGALATAVQAEVKKARAHALKPIVYGGATWCEPCRAIKKHRSEARMAAALQGTYVIELDIDEVKPAEGKALGYALSTVPVFIAVGDDGKATGPKIDGGAWGPNTPENMAPPLQAFFAQL